MKLGLRFDARDAPLLDHLAARVALGEIPGDRQTFSLAATAARTGEPLIVECDNAQEVHMMAAGYALQGVRQPNVETLPDWAKPK